MNRRLSHCQCLRCNLRSCPQWHRCRSLLLSRLLCPRLNPRYYPLVCHFLCQLSYPRQSPLCCPCQNQRRSRHHNPPCPVQKVATLITKTMASQCAAIVLPAATSTKRAPKTQFQPIGAGSANAASALSEKHNLLRLKRNAMCARKANTA